MAKVNVSRREVEVTLTLSEQEALYLYHALRYVNPSDDIYDELGGDSVFNALSDALEYRGVDLDAERETYAVLWD